MKIGIAGCAGRMGLTLVNAVLAHPELKLQVGSERDPTDKRVVQLLAGIEKFNVVVHSNELAAQAEAVIDFTSPEATLVLASEIARKGGIHIIGTTGFSAVQLEELRQKSKGARVVMSGNFSIGVNLLEKLVEEAARQLNESYDIEICEMHHRHKKDAPSGTALMLGEAAARGRKVKLADKKVAARDGITGERKAGDIGFSVIRGGDIVGVHHVYFAGTGEVVELRHQGFSREIYAAGALQAALWAKEQKPGFYSMRDVVA